LSVSDSADYSGFNTSSYHARMLCLLCHKRETNSPRPAVPRTRMSLVIDATVRLHAVPHGDYLALLYALS